jgi:hypothetical protein
MKPGNLIEVKPYKSFTGYYKLLTPNEYSLELQAGNKFNVVAIEPGMVLLYVEDVYWFDQLWCKVLLNDRVCHLHGSLINVDNFRPLDAPMFEAM